MNLNHVHLGSKNIDRFHDFYRNYFGFEKKSEHGAGVFLKNEAGFLIAVDPVDSLPALPDWYHLGFCLDREAAVHELYQRMTSDGVIIARDLRSQTGAYASFFVKDPDGNKLEVSWHNE